MANCPTPTSDKGQQAINEALAEAPIDNREDLVVRQAQVVAKVAVDPRKDPAVPRPEPVDLLDPRNLSNTRCSSMLTKTENWMRVS